MQLSELAASCPALFYDKMSSEKGNIVLCIHFTLAFLGNATIYCFGRHFEYRAICSSALPSKELCACLLTLEQDAPAVVTMSRQWANAPVDALRRN